MSQVTVITGTERRRPWSDEQKLALIEAAFAPGAKVAQVAAHADIRPSQIYRWRRDLLGAHNRMIPVVVTGHSSEAVGTPVIIIELKDATVRVRADAPASLLTAAVRAFAPMIPVPSDVRIWIALGRTDMRKGMRGLALQVQQTLKRDPHAGDIYVFRGRAGSLVKILWHDGTGMSLYAKRLERGRFIWPSASDGVVAITASAMACLLEGIDWRNPQKSWHPTMVG